MAPRQVFLSVIVPPLLHVYLSADGGSVGTSEPAVPTQSLTPKPRVKEVTNISIMNAVIYTNEILWYLWLSGR